MLMVKEFIVDQDTIELADFVVGIASTVPTNMLLDGAGIGIGSVGIRKFIRWHNATSLKTTENWNLALVSTMRLMELMF